MREEQNQGESDKKSRGRPRAWHDKSAQNTIKALDRAMEVLERLSQLGGVTLTELAQDLDQSPASVYRVLFTLEARDIVDFDQATQTWHIGAQAFLIGARFLRRTSLVERARPILRELMEATHETANLGMEREGQVLFVSQVETHETIRAFFPPGTLSPMHSSGIGKALLAHFPDKRLDAIIGGAALERFTPHTLTEARALRADLDATRARGYSIDAEEKNLGMRCIAAPIFDVHGEAVAGISVSGPTSRMTPDVEEACARAVMAAAAQLSVAVGGQGART